MARQMVGNALQLCTVVIGRKLGRQTDRQTVLLSSLNYHGLIAQYSHLSSSGGFSLPLPLATCTLPLFLQPSPVPGESPAQTPPPPLVCPLHATAAETNLPQLHDCPSPHGQGDRNTLAVCHSRLPRSKEYLNIPFWPAKPLLYRDQKGINNMLSKWLISLLEQIEFKRILQDSVQSLADTRHLVTKCADTSYKKQISTISYPKSKFCFDQSSAPSSTDLYQPCVGGKKTFSNKTKRKFMLSRQ